MNTARYAALVRAKFRGWAKLAWGGAKKVPKEIALTQDRELCLWREKPAEELKRAGFVTENFPKYSPDLNVIESAWALLKKELLATAPEEIEKRSAFLARLRKTVQRMNEQDAFEGLCTSQHKRATAVVNLKGCRTGY